MVMIELTKFLEENPKLDLGFKKEELEGITINQSKVDLKCLDSFWYDEQVFELHYKDRQTEIIASGEIRIHKKGEIVFDGKERESGFGFEVENDEQLSKVNEGNGFEWHMNNWFDIGFKKTSDEFWDYDISLIAHNLVDGLSQAILSLKDDDFWSD